MTILDAIKNKSYTLKPLLEHELSKPKVASDKSGLAEILARRIAMGYGQPEGDSLSSEQSL